MRTRDVSVEERYERLIAMQQLLSSVTRRIGPAVELDPVLREALAGMRALVNFRGGSIGLVDERGVYIAAADPAISPEVAEARVPVGTGLAGTCIATGEPVYSPDIGKDPRVDQRLRNTGSNRPMVSYLAVPLVCLSEVIGVMQVDSTHPDAFDEEDLRVLEGLAIQVAGAIESARRHEAMRHLDDARSMFVARVSHELRTPLTILLGLTQTLVTRPDAYAVSPAVLEILQRVDAAAGRLRALIEELITVGTLETGMLLQADESDVAIARVLEATRAESSDPLRVSTACPPDLRARVDPVLLKQALGLLVQNAIAYAGGAELTAAHGPAGIEIRVVDHGPGIPDNRKAQVFERFQRGEHAEPGWGLGLSVVKQLAATIGADLHLSDTPGGGATFTLLLPTLSPLL